MLKSENIVYLRIYINISCICKKNTAKHVKFGEQLLGLTLRVYPWLWNSVKMCIQLYLCICYSRG